MGPHARSLTGLLVAAVTAALTAVITAPPAAAHAELVSSTPAAGSTVQALPTTVTLTFSQSVRTPAYVEVTGPGGAVVASGTATVRDAEVTQQVGESVGGGGYVMSYRVTSADGHPITGTVRFSVRGGPNAGDTATAAVTDDTAGGIGTAQLSLLLGALALGLAAMAVGTRRALRQSLATLVEGPAGRSRYR